MALTRRAAQSMLTRVLNMRENGLNIVVVALAAAGMLANSAVAASKKTAKPAAASVAASESTAKPAPTSGKKEKKVYPSLGEVERLDPALDELIPPGAKIEKLSGGFEWAEGPVWDRRLQAILFSDVPQNRVYRWKEGLKTEVFLSGSGYTSTTPRGGEMGSNGLTMDSSGALILCQHGDRRVARLERDGKFTSLAEFYLDRRLNSPNDIVFRSNGDFYFTDPPYGLEGLNKDPKKEIVFNGVYLQRRKGDLVLLTADLPFPNGIALSPDEKTLYVAVSDTNMPVIVSYQVQKDGTIDKGHEFFNAKPLLAPERKGVPDGMKVDAKGNLFATGPGGVLVISPEGKHLGTINTGEPTANCGWGGDGSVLYITANKYLCRIQTTTKGKGF